MERQELYFRLGLVVFLISLYQLFILRQGHYFTLFSVGAFLILYVLHTKNYGNPFANWKGKHYLLYGVILLIGSLIIDWLGMHLGYWIYPHYTTILDEILKYLFEWVMPLTYMLLAYLLGVKFLEAKGVRKDIARRLSFFIGGILIGLFTEVFNVFVYSWQVLHMPFTDLMIGPFFVVFQTIGYWVMVLVVYICFVIVEELRKRTSKPQKTKNKKKSKK